MDKRISYVTRIFTLDRINQNVGIFVWNEQYIENILKDYEKHYGLKIVSKDK